jgi:hypothetical protein
LPLLDHIQRSSRSQTHKTYFKKQLSPEQCEDLLRVLKARFEKNMDRLENLITAPSSKSLGLHSSQGAKQCESFWFQSVNDAGLLTTSPQEVVNRTVEDRVRNN